MNYTFEKELLEDIAKTEYVPEQTKELFNAFIQENKDNYYNRHNMNGHITCSMLVLNEDKSKTLLTHHKKLNKWLQLGGHNDSTDMSVLETAVKEMFEEGFDDKVVPYELISNHPIDMDIHNVGDHLHFDICYACTVRSDSEVVCSHESNGVEWVEIKEILNNDMYEDRLKRMVSKVNTQESLKNTSGNTFKVK